MKKLVLFIFIVALFAGAGFAQVADGLSLSVSGHAAFVPLEVRVYGKDGPPQDMVPGVMPPVYQEHDKDTDLTSRLGPAWGGFHGRSARLEFAGKTQYAGFDFWLQTDGGSVDIGDFASIWVKPFDWMQFTFGKFNEDTLRGKVDDNDFHNFVVNMSDADAIFNRFGGNDSFQAMLSLTPLEGLFIGFQLSNLEAVTGVAKDYGSNTTPAGVIWETIQIGAGYEIDGIGHVRTQYIGAPRFYFGDWMPDRTIFVQAGPPSTWYYSTVWDAFDIEGFKRLELAFALSIIEDMILDVGVKIPIPDGEGPYAINAPIVIGAGFDKSFGDFAFNTKLDFGFGGRIKKDDDVLYKTAFGMNIHMVPSYNLGFATVALEIGMHAEGRYQEWDDDEEKLVQAPRSAQKLDIGIGPWIKRALGGGSIKAGLSYTIKDVGSQQPNRVIGIFRIPIVAEIVF